MFKIQSPENDVNYALFEKYLTKSVSFAVSGLTTLLRLLLIHKIQKITEKKILVITSTEQNALKYQNDLKKAFGVESDLIPFQNISMYESVPPNRYDYAEQVRILLEKPGVVIAPVKTLLEKFPIEEFYTNNSINIKIGDEIDVRHIAQKFLDLGYNHSTMVSDIGEFSIRGDIIDIFSLDKNAVRIELWGDEVVDIRYFNNETQKSIEKVKSVKIMPLYKFTLKNGIPDIIKKEDEDGYFEGIDVYQSYFNENMVGILDYFKDYILVYDETSELYAKYEYVDKNFEEQLQENLNLELNVELKSRNHITFEEFIQKSAGFVKVGLNNFLDSEMEEVIEFNSQPVQNFGANLDEIADFIIRYKDASQAFQPSSPSGCGGYKIIIATDYPERVKEILSEHNIFDIEYNESISSAKKLPQLNVHITKKSLNILKILMT